MRRVMATENECPSTADDGVKDGPPRIVTQGNDKANQEIAAVAEKQEETATTSFRAFEPFGEIDHGKVAVNFFLQTFASVHGEEFVNAWGGTALNAPVNLPYLSHVVESWRARAVGAESEEMKKGREGSAPITAKGQEERAPLPTANPMDPYSIMFWKDLWENESVKKGDQKNKKKGRLPPDNSDPPPSKDSPPPPPPPPPPPAAAASQAW